jgi:hypothetical protein
MKSDYQTVDRKRQLIFFIAIGLVLIAAIVSLVFQDWFLAGLSILLGLFFTIVCLLSKIAINPTFQKVALTILWLALGAFPLVFPSLSKHTCTQHVVFFAGLEFCIAINILFTWFGAKADPRFTADVERLITVVALICLLEM